MGLTLAVVTNDKSILAANLLASPCLAQNEITQVLVQERFASAAEAYNDALDRSSNDLIIFAHQDMYFPDSWLPTLKRSLEYLGHKDPRWGVLGCFGVANTKQRYGQVYSSGLGLIGNQISQPVRVRTLDEIVLILRNSSGLRFATSLPGFHFYGADICLRALSRGMYNYVVPGLCVHNTQLNPTLPREFYISYEHFKNIWLAALPIHTSCITVSRGNLPMYYRRFREFYIRAIQRTPITDTRLTDPRAALR